MIPEYFAWIILPISLWGDFAYIRGMLKGKTKPNRMSWLIWGLAPLVGIIFQINAGAGLSMLPVFTAGFGPVLILSFSFAAKDAYWKLGKRDFICGALSILALIFWIITRETNIALIFAIASDILASIPTIVKSWKHPETETGLVYILSLVNQIIGLLVITHWTFAIYSFGLSLALTNLALIVAIYRHRIFK